MKKKKSEENEKKNSGGYNLTTKSVKPSPMDFFF